MVLVGDADRNTVTCRPTSRRERERAFTLIEMLVVMVVIGILTAIAIPTYAAQKANARKAKVLIQMRTFQRAVESCAGDSYDETYFGCLGQNELASEVDRALDQIPWVEGPNPNEPEGSVDVDGIQGRRPRLEGTQRPYRRRIPPRPVPVQGLRHHLVAEDWRAAYLVQHRPRPGRFAATRMRAAAGERPCKLLRGTPGVPTPRRGSRTGLEDLPRRALELVLRVG